ncbi:tryptophan 2,3-dioxygenase family protein [Aquimarina sp. 2201CG1-2-11]|uniref:tryptophan 2,3-dioxygenase family protein n=1 Tax=Aquimarina discodermiae TaxID=3231043 RepID=UPI00346296AD
MQTSNSDIYQSIEEKYLKLGSPSRTHLKGLLHAKEVNYWSYIQLETLLSLQNPKTHFEDEEVFIIYHQITELVLKLVLNEIKQITREEQVSASLLTAKLPRIIRYIELLINSFGIMQEGMNYEDYNTFRSALAPASGFQSVQFRCIELYCTSLENLITFKDKISEHHTIEDLMELLYWKAAGYNPKTGKKSLTLQQFEEKYASNLLQLAKERRGHTLNDIFQNLSTPSATLLQQMRAFDYLYNIKWPRVHLATASHYLETNEKSKAATGGSEWKKYLDPKYQRRIFFPTVWSQEELTNWAEPCFF